MNGFSEMYRLVGVLLAIGGLLLVQYKRIHSFEYKTMGFTKTTLKRKLFDAIRMGVLGGIFGTLVILLLGVKITLDDFSYLLPVSLMFMVINVRYVCFAYGGSLLGIMNLCLGFPQMNIPNLMVIVGILHLVESILIWLDGYQHATPIFLEDEKHGIIGGFILQRFWPIPFVIMLGMMGALEGEDLPLQLSMVVAALGYSDMALSSTPRRKSKISAIRLLVYSIILISLSIVAHQYSLFKWITVIFAPLGHEALILWGQREEQRKAPLFRHHSRGITILDVKKNHQEKRIDLHPGDVILRMNNQPIDDKEDINSILKSFPKRIWMEIIDTAGKHRTVEYKNEYGIHHLGLIIVPRTSFIVFEPNLSLSFVKKWIERAKNK